MAEDNAYKVNWEKNWDEKICMWRQQSGHTPPTRHLKCVHSSRKTVSLLLVAAETGQLDRINVSGILKRLREMQTTDGSLFHGYIRWYWEEKYPSDPNAPFFAGLPLIVLWKVYRGGLSSEQRKLLLPIFNDLYVWFKRESQDHSWFYPNKSLGEIVCAWLLCEICSKENSAISSDRKELSSLMLEAAEYWTNHKWGWGEHMSDGYCKVCITEISLLLLLGQEVPGKVRKAYKKLLEELIAIEDLYEGGPRVPALRTYNYLTIPKYSNYRETIKPLPEYIDIKNIEFLTGHTLNKMGWHKLAPDRITRRKEIEIECFNNAFVRAHIEKDIRAGSVSRFPLMPTMDRTAAGLSWQSLPVAVSRPGKTWIYLQWETKETGEKRMHPAEDVRQAYRNYGLSETVNPPLAGQTWSLQKGKTIIVLRIMPRISTKWDCVTDRVRIIGEPGDISQLHASQFWHQLLLRWNNRELSINCIPLPSYDMDCLALPIMKTCGNFCKEISAADRKIKPVSPVLKKGKKSLDWNASYGGKLILGKRLVTTLWVFSLDGRIDSSPEISRVLVNPVIPREFEENAWEIRWKLPGKQWKLLVDPLSTGPLKEIR